MSSLGRKTVFYIFVGFFVFGAPALFLYGMGYRFNLAERQISESGSIYVDTTPKKSNISIPEYGLYETAPKLFNEMPTDDITVQISAEGYQTWEQVALVEPVKSVLYGAVELFLTDPVEERVAENVFEVYASPSGSRILLLTNEGISLFNSSNNEISWTNSAVTEISSVEWAQDEDLLVIFTDDDVITVTTSDGDALSMKERFPGISSGHPLSGERLLFSQSNEVVTYSPQEREIIERVPVSRVLDAWRKDDVLWILQTHPSGIRVSRVEEGVISLGDKKFSDATSKFTVMNGALMIIDGSNTWVFDNDERPDPSQVSGIVKDIRNGSPRFAVMKHGLFEIQGDTISGESILRLGTEIEDAYWYGNTGVMIYLSDGSVYAYDTQYGPLVNSFEIETNEIRAIAGSPRSGELYILRGEDLILAEIQ